jgi:mannose-6-phosphate isomerase-like protein (cupin superfamily)
VRTIITNYKINIISINFGEGKIELGELSGSAVIWNDSYTVKTGDVFEMMPKVVHRLSNDSGEVLRMIFFAPPSHLCDEDRTFI